MLKKIECFIQPFKLDEIKKSLVDAGVEGMSVTEIKGFGRQKGYKQGEKPDKDVKFLAKTKIEIIVDENIVEEIIRLIKKLARTNTIGAGKIFVIPVEDAVRISTEESGSRALH